MTSLEISDHYAKTQSMLKRLYTFNWKNLFGEFFVILLSILLAFAVDRCGEQWKERSDAIEYLKNLKKDLQDDVETLQALDSSVTQSERASGLIISHIGRQLSGRDSVPFVLFQMLSKRYDFYAHNATYESMKFSGDLKLLHNLRLKRQIVEHYNQYTVLAEVNEQYKTFQRDYTGHYFMEKLDYAQLGHDKAYAFLDDHMMRNIMYSNFGIFKSMKMAYKEASRRCNKLIETVEAELARLE